jgi:hypothetical protein
VHETAQQLPILLLNFPRQVGDPDAVELRVDLSKGRWGESLAAPGQALPQDNRCSPGRTRRDLEVVGETPGADDPEPHAGGGLVLAIEHGFEILDSGAMIAYANEHHRGRVGSFELEVNPAASGILVRISGNL